MGPSMRILGILLFLAFSANGGFAEEDEEYLRFPANFLLGAATSAYQIEGAWNASDKGESVWDRFVHGGNGRIVNDDTGDVAGDAYHKFKEDVAILKEIGFNWYRFSISWPRILPQGFANMISKDGLRYYHELVDELIANNIEPLITLYHWDHPQVLEDAGGWTNPEMVDWFGDYATVIFREFGPKVKRFMTVNEPGFYCMHSYSDGTWAPGKKDFPGVGEYLCLQNMLKAHARAYRIYEERFKSSQNGMVGVNIQMKTFYPKTPEDTMAAELAFQFTTGWVLHPVYSKDGDYPPVMKQIVEGKSTSQGYPRSRLPTLEQKWIEYIRGTADFLSVNHYSSELVEPKPLGKIEDERPSLMNDLGVIRSYDPSWKSSNSTWLKVVPRGFSDALRNLSEAYGNPLMYITENGVSDANEINDDDRISYFQEYLKEMLFAINRDKVNVKGYMAWSLLDNFEWARGYSERFGIVHINFTTPERRRTLKKSALWWKRVIQSGKLDVSASDIPDRPDDFT